MWSETHRSLYETAMAKHRQGNLAEARVIYRQLLSEDGTRPPTVEEAVLAYRFAPTLYVTPKEPFPLKDLVVIGHPQLPLLAYHLFWDDDIDFPADNDPCDHEVVWVFLDDRRERVERLYAYYHGQIVESREGAADAMARGGRARFFIQWGKHGSLPVDWESVDDGRLLEDMRRTYRRLHEVGCRDADHPLARGWPHAFTGSWTEFIDFSTEIDLRDFLSTKSRVMIGLKASAIIAVYFLRYCFSVKASWPDFSRPGAGVF